MGIIKVLPESIANRIAAGEVIERPGSIVKELVENSLDAGVKSIEISIRHGGKSLIRVADDGCGMTPEDAEIAFRRYATSKISDWEDLRAIGSYGFRGEALPSVAAVSRTKMITRPAQGLTGTEIVIEGGKLMYARQASCGVGTTIEVRDLFFNTPARRKFLKSDTTEMGHVTDIVSNIALSRRDIHFHFKAQDKTVFDLLPGQSLLARASAVLGGETAKHLLEFEADENEVHVWGLIGKPLAARASRSGQIFFVNRRCVKAYSLAHALQAGYHGLLMHHQFPAAVLFVELDPERVDVNVHPTKQEVRISQEPQVKAVIQAAVAARLREEADLAPDFRTQVLLPGPAVLDLAKPIPEFNPEILNRVSSRDDSRTFLSEPPSIYAGREILLDRPISLCERSSSSPENKAGLQITKILGQIHGTFLIAETEEGFVLVDQHAAHERVMFESLVKNFETGHPASQRLLMEEILEVPARRHELFIDALALLTRLGFEIEEFGSQSFVVRAVPAVFRDQHTVPFLKAFLDQKEEGKLKTDLENCQEEAAALIACKRRSVKAHEVMTLESMRSLLEQLSQCKNPFGCPHGRPAFLKYSFLELEKQFKRKG